MLLFILIAICGIVAHLYVQVAIYCSSNQPGLFLGFWDGEQPLRLWDGRLSTLAFSFIGILGAIARYYGCTYFVSFILGFAGAIIIHFGGIILNRAYILEHTIRQKK